MPLFIGMDEAGYGPNLGPLVITATSWPLADDPQTCDVWNQLSEIVGRERTGLNGRLHVGDSKEVYSTSIGLKSLETSVLSILSCAGVAATSFHCLWRSLDPAVPAGGELEPWFAGCDFQLPVSADKVVVEQMASRLGDGLDGCGIGRPRISSDVVLTRRFNDLTESCGSKGQMLSALSLALLRSLWEPDHPQRALVICDKHGGRNRYDELLADVLDGQMIFRVEERRERSVYRVGSSEVWFQTKAESHFPVAVASLVSKYVRELAMLAFNMFWKRHLPDVIPTKGYPTDAKRFRSDIAAKQAELGIDDDVLWRNR